MEKNEFSGVTKHSYKKLLKSGKVKDSDFIGGKIGTKKAKELYKDGIVLPHKYYIPRDSKAIKGGSFLSSLKKVGKTLKKTLYKTGDAIKSYADTVFHGRNDYPPAVRELIHKYGNKTVKSIIIDRTPVVKALQSVLNFVSGGEFNKKLDTMPYDQIFHLRIDITFEDGSRLAVEKNEVINMYENPKAKKGSEQKAIQYIPHGITLDSMLEEAKKIQGKKYFDYSAYDNNCQDFIMALLKGSNIGTEEDYQFVKQDSKSLFKGDSFLRKFANTVTDLGAKVNEITTGTGLSGSSHVQSVIFSKPEWTKRKAVNWLKKHDFTGLEVDEKPNTLRFRQLEPSDKYSYATKSIGNNIEFVICYLHKGKNSNTKYNKMTKKLYDSDTDSGSDTEEFSGTGIKQERAILKKMAKLTGDIHEHHAVHGGKINIAKAFTKLGDSIKHGWKKDIEKPAEKLANKAGKYITAKKGGLATDLIDYAVPAATSALVGGLAGMATGGVGGVLGSAAGSKLGKEVIAKELHKATGAGVRRKKVVDGDFIHIDVDSHNAKGKKATASMEGGSLGPRPPKGSPEMKEYMAKLRARKGKK